MRRGIPKKRDGEKWPSGNRFESREERGGRESRLPMERMGVGRAITSHRGSRGYMLSLSSDVIVHVIVHLIDRRTSRTDYVND